MSRMIDVGIDLGTTNTTIAVLDGIDARVIPNKFGSTVTPSAVWVDKRGRVRVGKEAREHVLDDTDASAVSEFKQLMGGGEETRHTFPDGTSMLPEELSAEVLKSVKLDYQSNTGKELHAAVITVPAAFENPSTTATARAAELAGFLKAPLLLEPAAASLAYGFQTEAENVYWFVYDFGGGTFDAAVMRVRDGQIQIVNHNGNNRLGGKHIDWDIVERKIVPVLTAQYDLPDFHKENPRWRGALRKLKYYAEDAKIEVCRTRRPSEIFREFLCKDASGTPVEVDFELAPEDVREVSQRHIESTLDLCRATLDGADLTGSDMARILMVGGSTLNPWVRDAVASEVNPNVEFGIDPVTVVARGAAIFASMQEHPKTDTGPAAPGTWTVEVVHKPVGNVPDPDIGGRVVGPVDESPTGYTIEFIDARTRWSTGRITLGADGAFMTQLHAERQRRHEFILELCDPTGTRVPVAPSSVSYTMGVVPEANPPVARTIGVGVHDGTVKPYFPKGTRLPARKTHLHRSAVALMAGDAADELRIPLVEGEHRRVDRNHTIGSMIIRGTDVKADLLVGSDVEITITMDESQLLKMQAYIPFLDQDFEMPFESRLGRRSMEELRHQLQHHQDRLERIRLTATETGAVSAEDVVADIVKQRLLEQVAELADRAEGDAEAELDLDRRLDDVAAAIDRAEDLIELPELVSKASEWLDSTRKVVEAYGSLEHRHQLQQLEELLERATRTQDADLIRLRTTQLETLYFQVLDGEDGYHLARFEWFAEHVDTMRDVPQANRLVTQGRRAIQNDDIEAVKATNRQLHSLLPREQQGTDDVPIGIF